MAMKQRAIVNFVSSSFNFSNVKKAKYIEAENDINKRKSPGTHSYSQLKYIFGCKMGSREFRSQMKSKFLYYCKQWDIAKSQNNTVVKVTQKIPQKIRKIIICTISIDYIE